MAPLRQIDTPEEGCLEPFVQCWDEGPAYLFECWWEGEVQLLARALLPVPAAGSCWRHDYVLQRRRRMQRQCPASLRSLRNV